MSLLEVGGRVGLRLVNEPKRGMDEDWQRNLKRELSVVWSDFQNFKGKEPKLVAEVVDDVEDGYGQYNTRHKQVLIEAGLLYMFGLRDCEEMAGRRFGVVLPEVGYAIDDEILASTVDMDGRKLIVMNLERIAYEPSRYWYTAGMDYRRLSVPGKNFSNDFLDRKVVDIVLIASEEYGHSASIAEFSDSDPLAMEWDILDCLSDEMISEGRHREAQVYYHAGERELQGLRWKRLMIIRRFPSLLPVFDNHLRDVLFLRESWDE